MNKPVFGLVLGAGLGVFDGLTAWFTPAVRPFLMGIVIGSTFKGPAIPRLAAIARPSLCTAASDDRDFRYDGTVF